MCMFVDEWDCKFEGNEIPIDVCKTCIKAKSLAREEDSSNSSTEKEDLERNLMKEENFTENRQDPSKQKKIDEEKRREKLQELDNKFNRGKLTVDEYIKKRKELNI